MPRDFLYAIFCLFAAYILIAWLIRLCTRREPRELRKYPKVWEHLAAEHLTAKTPSSSEPVKKTFMLGPYCRGDGCPIKLTCPHFEAQQFQNAIYWSRVPYDHDKKKCEFYPKNMQKNDTTR